MPRAYSPDLRERVILVVETGEETCRSAAQRFGVSASSAIKWVQRLHRAGDRQSAGTRLVFIDETWAKTNMMRTHGHWKTLTFTAPCVLDGPINSRSFTAYVEQFLVRTLRPGDVVILDNRGSHNRARLTSFPICHATKDQDQKSRSV